jgi:hypothetical protein
MFNPRTLGFQKLAALGALGACGGLFLILAAVFVFLHPYPRGGMDGTHYAITLMAFTGLLGAIIAVHLAFAHQLWYAPDVDPDPDAQAARIARSKRKARS